MFDHRKRLVAILAATVASVAMYSLPGTAQAATCNPKIRNVYGLPKAAPAPAPGVNLALIQPQVVYKTDCAGVKTFYWNVMVYNAGDQPVVLASSPTQPGGVRFKFTGPANVLSKASNATLDGGVPLLCSKSNGLLCSLLPDPNPAHPPVVLAPGASMLVQVTLAVIVPDGGVLHATLFTGKQTKTGDDTVKQTINVTSL